jgi:hypothetical protein
MNMNLSLKPLAIAAADYQGHRFTRELSEDTPVVCFRREITELA